MSPKLSKTSYIPWAVFLALLFCLAPGLKSSPTESLGYDKSLEAMVGSMGHNLVDLARAHQTKMAVGLFRENSSGQRSAFCVRLERDLALKMRTDTVMEVIGAGREMDTALKEIAGMATDFSRAENVRALGHLLQVDTVMHGTYAVFNDTLVIRVHLTACQDGVEIWQGTVSVPADELRPREADLIAGTRPASFNMSAIPAPEPVQGQTSWLKPTPTQPRATPEPEESSASASGHAPDLYRLSLGAGYKEFLPQNQTFADVTGPITGVYIKASWIDLLNLEFETWSASELKVEDIDNLFDWGIRFSGTWPVNLGRFVKIYGGAGASAESITVNGKKAPSQYAVSYGNNSVFGIMGLKAQLGHWGLDFSYSRDFGANYTGFTGLQGGVYYEFGH